MRTRTQQLQQRVRLPPSKDRSRRYHCSVSSPRAAPSSPVLLRSRCRRSASACVHGAQEQEGAFARGPCSGFGARVRHTRTRARAHASLRWGCDGLGGRHCLRKCHPQSHGVPCPSLIPHPSPVWPCRCERMQANAGVHTATLPPCHPAIKQRPQT